MEKLYDIANEVDAQMGVMTNATDKDGEVGFKKPYSEKIMGVLKNHENHGF